MILLKNVTYVYKNIVNDKTAIDNINMKIQKNSLIGLIGPCGSGKSTLAQIISKLIRPTCGEIIFDERKINLVFQYPEHQIFNNTVYDEINFGIKNNKFNDIDRKKKILDVLELVKLNENFLYKNPFKLSGGQQRRIIIASILIMQPDVLILDEPTVGLDFESREKIISYIKNIYFNNKTTVIIISHDLNVIFELVERIVYLDSGKIIFDGSAIDFFYNIKNFVVEKSETKLLIDLLNSKNFCIKKDIIKKKELVDFISQKLKRE
ncbi:MAG: energy-coupling factor ABC transporter ATP-binding protein [Clostridiales bacterium]|jgi:energy-coupling factor transport system ATP-binding protein|nr:energy-coupling factor ABC transporter ATP-binding protein [Clostridiales bacterium]